MTNAELEQHVKRVSRGLRQQVGKDAPEHESLAIIAADAREAAELRKQIARIRAAATAYFEMYGAEHLDGCPEDDTCSCPLVVALNDSLS